jgi:hypothetical protein
MSEPTPQAARRPLNIVLAVGIADAILLVVLLYFARIADDDAMVSILGPIHGLGFLVLLYLTVKGAGEKLWGWWFPAVVLVTGGPLGSIIGDIVLRRGMRHGAAA